MTGPVVITGGSRGIGAATARLLARRGHPVCIGYLHDALAAQAVLAECEMNGAGGIVVQADVARDGDVRRLFETADSALGRLGALVNNAGVVDRKCRVDELTADRVEQMMRVNVVGAFLCAREAVRRMSTRSGGSGGAIVSVSSRAAVLGAPGEYVDYAASKAAVDALTTGLAREVAAEGIRVNGVRPGLIDTDIHASGGRPNRVEEMAPSVPMGRGGHPEEVAEAIAWLISPAASYVTGTFIDVSGGR